MNCSMKDSVSFLWLLAIRGDSGTRGKQSFESKEIMLRSNRKKAKFLSD
jgi:hypothetical protein